MKTPAVKSAKIEAEVAKILAETRKLQGEDELQGATIEYQIALLDAEVGKRREEILALRWERLKDQMLTLKELGLNVSVLLGDDNEPKGLLIGAPETRAEMVPRQDLPDDSA